jgi:hypothetical protein
MRSLVVMGLTAALVLVAAPAAAHLNLTYPPPRTTSLKTGPCGAADSTRGATVTTLLPGQTITVTWDEFVDHPGHFRIAFDDDGQDLFRDPSSFEDVSGEPGVLIDGIADRSGGGIYSQEVDAAGRRVRQLHAAGDPGDVGQGAVRRRQRHVLPVRGPRAQRRRGPRRAAAGDHGAVRGPGGRLRLPR